MCACLYMDIQMEHIHTTSDVFINSSIYHIYALEPIRSVTNFLFCSMLSLLHTFSFIAIAFAVLPIRSVKPKKYTAFFFFFIFLFVNQRFYCCEAIAFHFIAGGENPSAYLYRQSCKQYLLRLDWISVESAMENTLGHFLVEM